MYEKARLAAFESIHDCELPEASLGVFITDNALVRCEVGEGFYDRIIRTTAGATPVSDAAAGVQGWLELELDREDVSHSDMAVRRIVPAGVQPLEPDSQIRRMIGFSLCSRRVMETRHYGWPLRGMSVQGVRIQRWTVADPERDDLIFVVKDDHWTDALVDFKHHSNWSFDADQPPATGLPWKPLWLPFLANSLVLGAPFVAMAVGFTRTLGRASRRASFARAS